MDKDRGTDCRGGAARHSAAWLPVIRTSCSLLFQAICVLSARIPAGADELCFKKNVPVRSRLREDTCQGAAATQRNAGVGFPSFRFSFPGTLFPASGMSGGSRSLLFGQRAVCHAFAQATDGDTPSYAGKCSVGFSAPAAKADGRCGGLRHHAASHNRHGRPHPVHSGKGNRTHRPGVSRFRQMGRVQWCHQ